MNMTNDFFEIVGNKAKGRISKRVFQENKARQIFWKTNISYPPDTHTYVQIGLVFLSCSHFYIFNI